MEDKGLTKVGYDDIIRRIINLTIKPPQNKTCYELNTWLEGYAECQSTIINIITDLKDQFGR